MNLRFKVHLSPSCLERTATLEEPDQNIDKGCGPDKFRKRGRDIEKDENIITHRCDETHNREHLDYGYNPRGREQSSG